MGRLNVALSAAVLAIAVALPARADGGAPVLLQLDGGCRDLPVADVRRILAADLGTTLVDQADAATTLVHVACEGDTVLLRVRDPLSRKDAARRVDLSDAAREARPRLVAIAASELVLASWSELALGSEPRVEPAGPAPPPAAREAAKRLVQSHIESARAAPRARRPADEHPLRVLGVVSRRAFFSHSGSLWGGGVRVGQDRYASIGWSLDAIADHGSLEESTASYTLDSVTLGAAIYFHHRWGVVTGRVGGGLRTGLSRSRANGDGQPAGTSTIAPWGWPLLTGALSLRLDPVVFEIIGEGGYAFIPTSPATSGVSDPGIAGPWYGLELGVGLVL